MEIRLLDITQQHLRSPEQIEEMVEFVRSGGVFTRECIEQYVSIHDGCNKIDLIEIAKFEDGKLFLRNGHHRVVGILLGGRETLYKEEYNVTNFKYSDFSEIHFLDQNGKWLGWVTPFDVRTHVRVADFFSFKREAKRIFYKCGARAATAYIQNNQLLYLEPKRLHSVGEIIESLMFQRLQ